jgi:poly(3-hydroxybutyrate) depolymerase
MEMARKRYRIVMNFLAVDGKTQGKLDGTVNAKTQIERQITANREWLTRKGHTETSLLVVDDAGHVLYDSKARQETPHERGLANASTARTQLAHWK